MGSVLSYYYRDGSSYNRSSKANSSLSNQTFKIKDRNYTLIKRLGGGAFGSVWSAVTPDGRSAAVKTIDVSSGTGSSFDAMELIESFNKEVTIAYKMRKETRHVVTIYGFDFDAQRGLALLAMELGGESLSKRIIRLHRMKNMERRRHRPDGMMQTGGDFISPRERKNIWVQLADIVQALHRHHVVHRDMKPDNLVFFGPIMKIVDLGIAQKEFAGYDPNAPGIGTQYFSAPECFETGAHITSKADIWSAGAILYNMTYGTPPVENSSYPPERSYPTRSASVAEVLDRCLQENVNQRASHKWLARHPYTTNPAVL